MRGSRLLHLLFALLIPMAAAAQPKPAEPLPPLKVVVTVAPLRELVRPLIPEGSEITVLMPPGKSEHGHEFTPAQVAHLAKADMVVYVGLNLEPRLEKLLKQHPRAGRLDVCFAGVVGLQRDADIEPPHAEPGAGAPGAPGAPAHDHDDECDDPSHEHGKIDPHLWLDPLLCADLAGALSVRVVEALEAKVAQTPKKELSEHQRQELARSEAVHLVRVTGVHEKWEAALAPHRGRAIVTHHNAFSRPAERYGLRVAAVIRDMEGAEVGPAQIAGVVEAIRKEGVTTIFVEPQFDPKAARRLAKEAGVATATLDPMGEDWFKMMDANLRAILKSFEGRPAP